MNRRDFLKLTLGGAFAGGILTFLNGCVARVSEAVYDKAKGTPWRCSNCGYLTRSTEDLSNTRCPRCMEKDLKRITEEELQKYIAEEKNKLKAFFSFPIYDLPAYDLKLCTIF